MYAKQFKKFRIFSPKYHAAIVMAGIHRGKDIFFSMLFDLEFLSLFQIDFSEEI